MKPKSLGHLFSVTLKVAPVHVIVLAVLTLAASYFIKPEYREEIKFAATLFGGTAAIYSAYYVGVGLRLKIARDKQQASFCTLDLLNKPEFVEVRKLLSKEVSGSRSTVSDAAMYDKITASKELDSAVGMVLGILEDSSIAIQEDYVDEVILYKSMFVIVKTHYSGLSGYITSLRKATNEPGYFVELEKLNKAWSEGKRLSDGQPFDETH